MQRRPGGERSPLPDSVTPAVGGRRDEQGFTLLELMIALFVLSVAVAGLVGVLDTAFGTTAVDVHRIDATGLAAKQLATLRARPYADIEVPSTAGPVTTAINNQQFTTSYTTSWTSSTSADANAYKQVTVSVTWRDQVGAHTIEESTAVYPGGLGPYDTTASQGPSPTTTTTITGCPAPVVTAAPLVSAQSAGDPSVDVSWPEPDPTSSVVPIVAWAVQDSPDGGTTWTTALNDEPPLAVGLTHQIEIGGLTPGTSYEVRLQAFGACGAPGLSTAGTAAGPITATLDAPDCTIGAVSLSAPVAVRQPDGSLSGDLTVVASTATGCTAGLWAGVVTAGTTVAAVPLTVEPGPGGWWFSGSLDAAGPWDLGPHTVEVFSGLPVAGPLPSPPLAVAEMCVAQVGGASC
jgi:prepilin-type N-terminal cleavage/methylation domain-containing protein